MKLKVLVTGCTGFIGNKVAEIFAKERSDLDVYLLCRDPTQLTKRFGNFAHIQLLQGDLLSESGNWRGAVEDCHYIIHLAQPTLTWSFIHKILPEEYQRKRFRMDKALLEFAATCPNVKSVVFVLGTSYYGEQGPEWKTEEVEPNPRGFGRLIVDSVKLAQEYSSKIPVVLAFPCSIYGNGSWCKAFFLGTFHYGLPTFTTCAHTKYQSFMHVEDCARALIFLMAQGKPGESYFLTDDEPQLRFKLLNELAVINQRKNTMSFKIPYPLMEYIAGKSAAESMICEYRLSNKKLKDLGFKLKYPTIHEGLPSVVEEYRASVRYQAPKILILVVLFVVLLALLIQAIRVQ